MVAFPLVTGPKPAGRGPTAKGVVAAFEEAGIEVLRGDPLEAVADELGVDIYSAEVARTADCDYTLRIVLRGRGRRFVAEAILLRAWDGSRVASLERPYGGKREAFANGRKLGASLAAAIAEDRAAKAGGGQPPASSPGEGAVEELPSLPPAPPKTGQAGAPQAPLAEVPIVGDVGDVGDEPSARAGGGGGALRDRLAGETARRLDPSALSRPKPRDEDASFEVARAPDEAAAVAPERRMLRLSVGAGSRLYTAYSVSVGGNPTRLGYTLDPLVGAEARGVFLVPGLPLGVEADLAFTPVRFRVPTTPPVQPAEPSGQFIDAGGALGWRLDLARIGPDSWITLTPRVGAQYASLSVEEQRATSVVLSWSTLAVVGGLRAGLELGRALGVELEASGGPVLGFSESPTASGEEGSGFEVAAKSRLRLWPTAFLGAQLAAGYAYRSVGLSGTGSRAIFEGDPPLVDAEIAAEAVDVTLAVVLAI